MINQIILNGIISGSIYAIIAIGFSLIYNIHHFFYIANGALLAVGAFAFYSFYQLFEWGPIFSFLCAIVITIVSGTTIEVAVHKPLRKIGGNNLLFF